jgi:hypothetical protein
MDGSLAIALICPDFLGCDDIPSHPDSGIPKGAVYIRRYDKDSPDGHAKAGTIDMVVEHATFPTMEQTLGQIQKLPEDLEKGYVTVLLVPKTVEPGSHWNYKFTGMDPARVVTIIRAQASTAPLEKKPGSLAILRINSFTTGGGLLPKGLNVYVWAGEVPADVVLDALNELEAMNPRAGIPQEVRKVVPPGVGKGPTITIDLDNVDPLQVRDILEKALSKAKH